MFFIRYALMLLPKSTVGRKLLMAFTGQVLILFIIFHVLGNSTVYFSAINAYAAGAPIHMINPEVWQGQRGTAGEP